MTLRELINQSIEVQQCLLNDEYIQVIERIGEVLVSSLRGGHMILVAGNGGSAADAQHFAAELAGKFVIERKGLPAMALTTNTSIITAIGNDFSYDQIFARQIEAYGRLNDVFIGITTSGNSKNILEGFRSAKQKGLITVGILGSGGGNARALCNLALVVPSVDTPRIQEAHVIVIHLLSYLVDCAWAGSSKEGVVLPEAPLEYPTWST